MAGGARSVRGGGGTSHARSEPLRALAAGLASLFFLFATFATFGPWFSLRLALLLTGASIVVGLLGMALAHQARHALRRNPWVEGQGLATAGWVASLAGVVVSSIYNGVAVFALHPLAIPLGVVLLLIGVGLHGRTVGAEDAFLAALDGSEKMAVCTLCRRRLPLYGGRWRGARWLCASCTHSRPGIAARFLRAFLVLSLVGTALFVLPAEPVDAFCEILEPPSDLPTEVRGTLIEIELTEGFARIVIIKEFFNPSDRFKEGQVFFPLEKGHELITDLSLKIGAVVYNSSAEDREEALDEFLENLANGKDAALVQYDPARDVYWVAVTIPPRESRTTITTLEMPLAKRDGFYGYDYRLSVDAGHSTEYLRLHVRVQTSAPLDAVLIPSHPSLAVHRLGTGVAEAYINSSEEAGRRDLEIRFRSTGPSIGQFVESVNGSAVRYIRFSLESRDDVFAGSLRPMPRSFLFLVDASGSMGRDGRWALARETVLALARNLGAGESFAAAAFQGKEISRMSTALADWMPSSEARLAAFLDSLAPRGSTSLTRALPLASRWAAEASARGQQPILFLISDGRPTVGTLPVEIEGAYRRLVYDRGVPVFALAVNPADHSDENLLRNLSHFNHGELVTVHDGGVASAASSVLSMIRVPVLQDVQAVLPEAQRVVLASRNPQDLVEGGEAVLVARLSGTATDPLAVELVWGPDVERKRGFSRTFAADEIPIQVLLKKQWVLTRIHGMLEEIAVRGDPEVIEDLKILATANRVVTPYTSLLVTIPDPAAADSRSALLEQDLGSLQGLSLGGTASAPGGGFRLRFTSPLDREAVDAQAFWDSMRDPLVADAEVDRYVLPGSAEHRALESSGAIPRVVGQHISVFERDGELIGVLGGWTDPSRAYGLAMWSGFWTAAAVAALWGIVMVQRRVRRARPANDYE